MYVRYYQNQRSLALKTTHNPTHQFDHLYRLICQEECTAVNHVLSNQGARTAGIDGLTKRRSSRKRREPPLCGTTEELREKQFRPVPFDGSTFKGKR